MMKQFYKPGENPSQQTKKVLQNNKTGDCITGFRLFGQTVRKGPL
jgi:hypothetical protein